MSKIITQTAHGFTTTFIRYNGSAWVAAQANLVANVATHFAYRIDDDRFYLDSIKRLTSYSNITDDASAPLAANTVYYLSSTVAGKITSTAPAIKQLVLTTVGDTAKVNITNYTNATFEPEGSIDIPSGEHYKIGGSNLSGTNIGLSAVTDNAQVKKLATTTTIGNVPAWDGTTGDALTTGYGLSISIDSPGVDTKLPSEKAVRSSISGSGGDVTGPASAVDNQIARFHLDTGKIIQTSLATSDNNGSVNIPSSQTYKINGTNLSKSDIGLGSVTDNAQLKAASNLSDVATRQTALNNLVDGGGSVDEFVVTKDTVSGNAMLKASAGGLPAGTTNYTIRYNGSAWAITNVLQTKTDGVYGAFYENTSTNSGTGATCVVDWKAAGVHHVVLNSALVSFKFISPTGKPKYLKLIVLQDGTGGRYLTWPDTSITPPGDRYGNTICYDPYRDETILFGGFTSAQNGETWKWNGSYWDQLSPAGSPSARSGHAMVYNPVSKKIILFGGNTGSANAETWEWTGTTWNQLSPTNSPTARYGHSMVYDETTNKIYIFGGYNGTTSNQETWEYNGTTWTQLFPASKPSARFYASMNYVNATGKSILFGGFTGAGNNETWEWNGANWSQLSPAGSPTVRYGHSASYDIVNNKIILFGGNASATYNDETWQWNGTTWTQLTPTASPTGRHDVSSTYDSTAKRILQFGGYNGASIGGTYKWNGTTWQTATGNQIAFDKGVPITLNMAPNGATLLELFWDGDSTYRCVRPMRLENVMSSKFFQIIGTASGFLSGFAIGSGTSTPTYPAEVVGGVPHNGILRSTSTSSYNTGYRYGSGSSSAFFNWRCSGGDVFIATFKVVDAVSSLHLGWFNEFSHDESLNTGQDGIYLNMAYSPQTIYGKTAAAGTRSTTSTGFNPSAGTWYTAVIYTDYSYTNAYFKIYSNTGVLLWSDSIGSGSNFPTVATSYGWQPLKSTTGAAINGLLDFMLVGRNVKWTA